MYLVINGALVVNSDGTYAQRKEASNKNDEHLLAENPIKKRKKLKDSEIFDFRKGKPKVYINGKMYFKAKEEKWLTSFAYYVHWAHIFPHKYININDLRGKKSTIYKHISILEKNGLLTNNNGIIKLISNKAMGGKFPLYFHKNDLNSIKAFLKVVPVLSNLHYQTQREKTKKYFRKISHKIANGVSISKKEYLKYNRFLVKHSIKRGRVQLSIKGAAKLMGTCEKTTLSLLRTLEEFRLVIPKKCVSIVGEMNFNDFMCYRKHIDRKVKFFHCGEDDFGIVFVDAAKGYGVT